MRRSYSTLPILVLLAVALGPLGSCSKAPAAGTERATARQPQQAAPPAYDELLTDQARVLAGMMPQEAGRFAKVTSDKAWQDYRAEFEKTWGHSESGRFKAMAAWRDAELSTAISGPCDTLFYPFSGPDIVNAWVLFPDCSRYVMFGLEHTGAFPQLDTMDSARVDRLLANVRRVIAELFERNYFITKEMMTDLDTPELEGTLPVLALLLARLGSTIVAVTPLELTPTGVFVAPGATPAADRASVPAVRIDTLSPSGTRQQVLYFRIQADNAPLAKHAGMGIFLGTLRPYRTLIKSASYLMHDDGFSRIRGELLDGSSLILQDDTGIPFRFLDRPEWDVRLFGRYAKPIKDFGYRAQGDLEAAFAQPGRARPLPFTWGYHWRDGTSHAMLAVRRTNAEAR